MYQHARTQASADAKTHPREMQERQGRSVPQRFLSCLHGMQARDFEDAERCSKASKSPPPFPKGSGDAFPEAPTASPKSIPTSSMAGLWGRMFLDMYATRREPSLRLNGLGTGSEGMTVSAVRGALKQRDQHQRQVKNTQRPPSQVSSSFGF